jgi:hypothetical protein
MAGRRRGTGRPTVADARQRRRRQYLTDRLAAARTPMARLTAATEYARGVLSDLEPHAAELVAAELADHLIAAADLAAHPTR